jgi:hypothetical protein
MTGGAMLMTKSQDDQRDVYALFSERVCSSAESKLAYEQGWVAWRKKRRLILDA